MSQEEGLGLYLPTGKSIVHGRAVHVACRVVPYGPQPIRKYKHGWVVTNYCRVGMEDGPIFRSPEESRSPTIWSDSEGVSEERAEGRSTPRLSSGGIIPQLKYTANAIHVRIRLIGGERACDIDIRAEWGGLRYARGDIKVTFPNPYLSCKGVLSAPHEYSENQDDRLRASPPTCLSLWYLGV